MIDKRNIAETKLKFSMSIEQREEMEENERVNYKKKKKTNNFR